MTPIDYPRLRQQVQALWEGSDQRTVLSAGSLCVPTGWLSEEMTRALATTAAEACLALSYTAVDGYLFMVPNDQVIAPCVRKGDYEPFFAARFREVLQPGQCAIDVGANIGLHTLSLARLVGPTGTVWALEPDQASCVLLKENLRLNGLEQVRVLRQAAGSERRSVRLFHNYLNAGDHSLWENPKEPRRPQWVEEQPLDDLVLGKTPVQLLKIDTQGYEVRVLRGAKKILAQDHLHLAIEFWPHGLRQVGDSPEEFAATLRHYGFKIFGYHADRGDVRPMTAAELLVWKGLRDERFLDLWCVE